MSKDELLYFRTCYVFLRSKQLTLKTIIYLMRCKIPKIRQWYYIQKWVKLRIFSLKTLTFLEENFTDEYKNAIKSWPFSVL